MTKRLKDLAMLMTAALVAAPLGGRAARADHVETARSHYERGLSAYGLGHYGDAAAEYEAAFALKPDPALLYNAAQAHRLAGNKTRALQLYQSYLSLFGESVPNRAEVQRHIVMLKEALESDQKAQTSPPVTPRPMHAPDEPTAPPPAASAAAPAATPPVALVPAPDAAAASSLAPTASSERPWYKRPWVWGTAAGAVVVVTGAIVLGVTLGSTTHDPSPTFGSGTLR